MRYIKVTWTHNFVDEPVLYLSELGEDDYETRRVQFFRDGHSEWADQDHETSTTGLSEIPFLEPEEISKQSEFSAKLINADEFEQAWNAAQ
ncbi:hypothetical protein ACE1OC_41330 [Streptomyces sp. DSM 116496]|uniref:DUF6881 domain-containing protein n=1 Tax=Streptomyces stoeckheimensis TaxID=3344656 RepID=UPI0038B412E3